jgi:hypothetical protein
VPINMPARSIQGVELSPEEYYRFTEMSGKATREAMTEALPGDDYREATDGPDGGKALVIREIVNRARAQARSEMLGEFPDLESRVEDLIVERGTTLSGSGAPPLGGLVVPAN